MSNKIYIIQDGYTDGSRIIEELEKRGGVNRNQYEGDSQNSLYFIDENMNIEYCFKDSATEAWLSSNGYYQYSIPKMPSANIYIESNVDNGGKIIEELTKRGGKNISVLDGTAGEKNYYYIDKKGYISVTTNVESLKNKNYEEYVLPDNSKTVLYYARVNNNNGEAILKALEAKGGKNVYRLKGESQDDSIVFLINYLKKIDIMNINTFKTYKEKKVGYEYKELSQSDILKYSLMVKVSDNPLEVTVNFADSIPKGYEVVDESGNVITDAIFSIRKKKFCPKLGDIYYYVDSTSNPEFHSVGKKWCADSDDEANYIKCNYFETREKAERLAFIMNSTFAKEAKSIQDEYGSV